jgi:hypothetical protein
MSCPILPQADSPKQKVSRSFSSPLSMVKLLESLVKALGKTIAIIDTRGNGNHKKE